MQSKRKYKPASFEIPAEIQLKELQRRENAKPAAEEIMKALGLLFAHSPERFPKDLRDCIIRHVQSKVPASFEAWTAGGWKG